MREIEQTAIGFIPARIGSSRLPEKPLVDLNGKTLIHRVWEAASKAHFLERVIVATDDRRIADECEKIGAEYLLTPSNLASGTDRIAYAYAIMADQSEIILNIQGDEPLLESHVIDKLVREFAISKCDVGTLVRQIDDHDDLDNPGVVKVVMNHSRVALYFSRSVIPHVREFTREEWLKNHAFWKHIGIYAFRRNSLFRFTELMPSVLERTEQLEQLRLLEDGAQFLCVETDVDFVSVDTAEDAERVRGILTAS